jgi:nitrate reductase molybdenum cofactor assembly chaperone NarJ/NarW
MTTSLPIKALDLLSVLLHYPDDVLLSDLSRMRAAVARLDPGDLQQAIDRFLGYLAKHPLLTLQTAYTAAFDLNPATTLNLTWHRYGDNEKRAAALARLQRQYDVSGWERTTGDLPDYLPLMLEFMVVCPQGDTTGEIRKCLGGLETLIEPLAHLAPAYAELLRPLAKATK